MTYTPTERRTIPHGTLIVWWMLNATLVRKRLGRRVRTLLENRGWSQEDLAHERGFPPFFHWSH
jgi:ribosome-binding protein aMBF1 (putative translation factor)